MGGFLACYKSNALRVGYARRPRLHQGERAKKNPNRIRVGISHCGGSGGNRTRVRKSSTGSSTYLVRSFGFNPCDAGRTGCAQAIHLGFSVAPSGPAHCDFPEITVPPVLPGPARKLAGVRSGLKRPERNARRWRLLISSRFTRGLVLGMPCSASRPPSKPGRTQSVSR